MSPRGLTLRALTVMVEASLRSRRADLVAQAALVWSDAGVEARRQFILTGVLGSRAPIRALPPDPMVEHMLSDVLAAGGKLDVDALLAKYR